MAQYCDGGHWLVLVLVLMVILVYLRAYDCVRPYKPKWLKSNLLMQSAFYESSFCLTGKLRIKYNPHPINSKYDVLLSLLWKWAHVHWSRILWFAITIFLLYFFSLLITLHCKCIFPCYLIVPIEIKPGEKKLHTTKKIKHPDTCNQMVTYRKLNDV